MIAATSVAMASSSRPAPASTPLELALGGDVDAADAVVVGRDHVAVGIPEAAAARVAGSRRGAAGRHADARAGNAVRGQALDRGMRLAVVGIGGAGGRHRFLLRSVHARAVASASDPLCVRRLRSARALGSRSHDAPDELRLARAFVGFGKPPMCGRRPGQDFDERIGLDRGQRDRNLGDARRGHHAGSVS
jgi:hypothetical protein